MNDTKHMRGVTKYFCTRKIGVSVVTSGIMLTVSLVVVVVLLTLLSTGLVQPVYSHPVPRTGVNFVEFFVQGGIDGKKEAYTYINSTNELVFSNFRNDSDTKSKTLNTTEIAGLNNIVNSSDLLNREIYDTSHVCQDCQQYRLSYIYTIVNDKNGSAQRYSGTGLWNDASDNENKLIYGKVGDFVRNLILSNSTG